MGLEKEGIFFSPQRFVKREGLQKGVGGEIFPGVNFARRGGEYLRGKKGGAPLLEREFFTPLGGP